MASTIPSGGETLRTTNVPWYDGGPQGMRVPPVFELCRLRRRQWQSAEVLQESQRRKLLKTVSLAYQQVSYYRELLDAAGIAPKDINDAEDLDALPITERHAFQARPLEDMTALNANLNRCKRVLTSGSTARPLMVYRNRREDNLIDMTWAFAFLENGQRLWDKCADFHSFPEVHSRWFERIGVWRRVTIPSLAEPGEQVELVKRIRPDVIRGDPACLVNLATTIKRKAVQGIKPRLVFAMGSLLDKSSRVLIESVFGAEVFDYYGSTELGCIGWECSMHEGYHINTDSVVLEVIDHEGRRTRPGERGKIVCTGLITDTMPFIRYYTGDVGVIDDRKCPCGRGLPLLSHLEGRAYDFFILRDGTELPYAIIQNNMKRIQGIEQYKVVQENVSQINVQVVPDEKWTAQSIKMIRAVLEQITRRTCRINVEIVNNIPQDKSGKIQAIVSRVPRAS